MWMPSYTSSPADPPMDLGTQPALDIGQRTMDMGAHLARSFAPMSVL